MKPALIIFQKNQDKGRVKTRLARSVGDQKALDIYEELVNITADICVSVESDIDIHVFYNSYIPEKDRWAATGFHRHVQSSSEDLGCKMKDAFERIFEMGYKMVSIIGTDCPYLTSEIINNAFKLLISNDVVVGPALDGGFYFLGIRSLDVLNFQNITWSTSTVLETYMQNLTSSKSSVILLTALEDIDDESDYIRFQNHVNPLNNN